MNESLSVLIVLSVLHSTIGRVGLSLSLDSIAKHTHTHTYIYVCMYIRTYLAAT